MKLSAVLSSDTLITLLLIFHQNECVCWCCVLPTHTRNQSVGVIAEGINFQERRKDYGSRGRSNTHLNSTYRCVLNADFDAVPNIKLRHLIAPLQRSSSSLARSYSCCRNKKPLHSFLSYELEHNLRSSDSFIRLPGGNCLSSQFTGIQLLKQTSRVSVSCCWRKELTASS